MTTSEVRQQTKEFALDILTKPDNEQVTLNAGKIKDLMFLIRDYAVLTHATDQNSEVAAAVEQLVDYIERNENSNAKVFPSYFKTTQLADIFGVSVTAINNWIDEGRFVGYKREAYKHAKIPHFTPFKQRNGSIEPLGNVIERYTNLETSSFAVEDERAMLQGEIETLQQKYSGKKFEDAFPSTELSPEQESDATRWNFYLKRLASLSHESL